MILEFIQSCMNYIVGYFGLGFIWFLIQYGRTIRRITRHNQIYRNNQLKVNWGYMVGMCWILWPVEVILRLVKFISLIGVQDMWDYDKLFAEGNVIGLLYPDGEIIPIPCKFREESNIENLIKYYGNKDLKCEDYKIQYIIRLDEHGNVIEKLFDRETDMPKPMPELEDGMFIRIYSTYKKEGILVLIYDNRVIYQDGEWDEVYDLTEDVIMEVYSDKALCFNNCQSHYLIWQNPLSNKSN